MALTRPYALAKIETEKEIPIVQVLDAAVPSLKKSALKGTLIVLTTTGLAFTFGFLWIFIRVLLSKKYGPEALGRLAAGWKTKNSIEHRLKLESPVL